MLNCFPRRSVSFARSGDQNYQKFERVILNERRFNQLHFFSMFLKQISSPVLSHKLPTNVYVIETKYGRYYLKYNDNVTSS